MSCPTEETLLLCAEGERDGAAHLEECASCRNTVEELKQTMGALREAAPAVAEATGERLLRLRPPAPCTLTSRRIFMAAAASLLAVTGFALFRSKGKPMSKPAPESKAVAPPSDPKIPAKKQDPGIQDEMIQGGLAWLAANQKPDGSFGNPGLTGLSLMAWFGAGHGENSALYARSIQSAIASLLSSQFPDGHFSNGTTLKHNYDHAVATWALAEALSTGRSTDPRVRLATQKATAYLVAGQNPGKGWRYSSKCGDNDTSVTYWAAGALVAARSAGFEVPESCFEGARAWIREVTMPGTMSVGYNARGTGKVYVPGMNENYLSHETMAAGAMALRLMMGDARDDSMAAAVGFLATDPPSAGKEIQVDYYYWHLGTLGLYLHDGPESLTWQDWSRRLGEAMTQRRAADGSWDPNDRWGRDETAGRVYATAINVLTLEIPARARK